MQCVRCFGALDKCVIAVTSEEDVLHSRPVKIWTFKGSDLIGS